MIRAALNYNVTVWKGISVKKSEPETYLPIKLASKMDGIVFKQSPKKLIFSF